MIYHINTRARIAIEEQSIPLPPIYILQYRVPCRLGPLTWWRWVDVDEAWFTDFRSMENVVAYFINARCEARQIKIDYKAWVRRLK